MTFPKILSGDFVAQYNRLMDELYKDQIKLDEKYRDEMDKIIQQENERLVQTLKPAFKVGDIVETFDRRQGKVVKCKIQFDPRVGDGWDNCKPYGPAKYYELKNESDENIMTCEDLIQHYSVEFQASELESDWGKDVVIGGYYADELSYIDDKE